MDMYAQSLAFFLGGMNKFHSANDAAHVRMRRYADFISDLRLQKCAETLSRVY